MALIITFNMLQDDLESPKKQKQSHADSENIDPAVDRDALDEAEDMKAFVEHSKMFPETKDFYATLRPNYTEEVEQPKDLANILYPYQRRAVRWMLHRETGEGPSKNDNIKHKFEGGSAMFCRGGILAEEMGLGKTLELLGLIVMNPRDHPRNDNAPKPPTCKESLGFIDSKCTLIIIPSTLMSQWKTEIQKHAPSLKVKEYEGTALTLLNSKQPRCHKHS
jgi:SNF2 family DNA or RNA helicase